MSIWYATREEVKAALDAKETARNNVQVDRAIEGASRTIEGITRRFFYPVVDTRYFNWPNRSYASPWRLWLDGSDEIISVTTLTSGGNAISSSDYFLEPVNSGPPYDSIEIDLSSSASFSVSDTAQRSIEVTGVFGYSAEEASAGMLAEALDGSETGVNVTNSAAIGIGTIIRIDSERMIVTGKSMLDSTQNLQANMDALDSNTTVAVSDGSTFSVDEVILIDAEKMLIVDIAGNNLVVIRAWDGSPLATHTATADIYAARTLTVERGALGTTAATHSDATAIVKHVVPGMIRMLCVAEAINTIEQELSGYARRVRFGESERDLVPRGLQALRDDVIRTYGRRARAQAV